MIDKLIRRAVFAIVFCASSLAADSYHPHIVKSQVVSLDVAAIERSANSSTPFDLDLGETALTVVLSPSPVWPEEGLTALDVEKDGSITKRIVQGNITYAGEVVGEDPEASEARLAIAHGVLEGYVLSKTGWWFIEPLSRFDPKAGDDQHLVYATRDLDFVLDFGDDRVNSEVTGWDPPSGPDGTIPLLMVADREYIDRSGTLYHEWRHAILVHMINGIYKRETGRRFRMTVSIGDFGGNFLTMTDAHNLLIQLYHFVQFAGGASGNEPQGTGLNNLRSWLAHLTTAKELNGVTMGVADEPGRWGLSQQTVLPPGGGTIALGYQNLMLAAHEIGHNFFAKHEDADEICVDWDLWWCDDYQRTLMWPSFHGDNQPRFSDGTHDTEKNNKRKVREFMTSRGF